MPITVKPSYWICLFKFMTSVHYQKKKPQKKDIEQNHSLKTFLVKV